MGCITRSVPAGLVAAIGVGEAGQQSGIEIISAARALVQRVAGPGGISAPVGRIIAVGNGVSERISLLMEFATVIPGGMAYYRWLAGHGGAGAARQVP